MRRIKRQPGNLYDYRLMWGQGAKDFLDGKRPRFQVTTEVDAYMDGYETCYFWHFGLPLTKLEGAR